MNASPYTTDNIRRGAMHYLLGRGVAGLAGFATIILLVRNMDVASYAGYTAISGLIMMSGVIAGLGLERAIARYVPQGRLEQTPMKLASFIWRTALLRLMASLLFALLVFGFWPQIKSILEYIDLVDFPVPLALFLVAENLFAHFSSVFQAMMMQKMLTRLLVIQWGGRLLLIFAVLLDHTFISLEAALWIMAIPELLGVLIFIVALHYHLRHLESHHSVAPDHSETNWPDWKPALGMSLHNYGFSLLAAPPQGYFMRMLVSATLSAETVAAYGFFQSIAEKARQYIPLHFFHSMIEPVLIARYLQDRDFAKLSQLCQLLYKSNVLVFVPAIAWVAAAGPDIAMALTGGKFADQSWVLLIVMVQLLIGSHVVVLQLILNALGRSKLLIKASFLALMGMTAYWLAVSQINTIGVLFGPIIFSLMVNMIIVMALVSRGFAYRPSWEMLRGTVLAGLIASGAVFLLLGIIEKIEEVHIVAVVSGLVVLGVYGMGIHTLSIVKNEEVSIVRGLFTKKAPVR